MLVKYYVFMVIGPFYTVKESLRELKITKQQKGKPKRLVISVIIPARDEEVGIVKTVQSVIANTYSDVEIIIVNDGSKDRTDERVREFMQRETSDGYVNGKHLVYFYKENAGKGAALNYGIERATGEIIMTIDADSVVAKDALTNMAVYFQDDRISAVVGNVKVSKNETVIGLIQRLEYMFGFYFKRTHAVLGAEYIFGGACAAFRKSIFDTLGLFDVHIKTEDIEMSMRIRFNGHVCTYAENVICYTEGASTVASLLNQRLRWKKGRFDTFLKYRSLFWSSHKDHNKALAFFILPYTLLSEAQLFFEPIGITLLLSYSYISGDYISLTFGVMFIFVIYLINAIFHHEGMTLKLLLLFPFSWPLFYFLVWVEYLALLQSFRMLLKGDEIEWQRWDRTGVQELPYTNTTLS